MGDAYEVTRERGSIVIRLPQQLVDEEGLTRLLDYLELEALQRRSQLSAEDAASIAKDVKEGAWQETKHLFEE